MHMISWAKLGRCLLGGLMEWAVMALFTAFSAGMIWIIGT
jgi:hypothetical protein